MEASRPKEEARDRIRALVEEYEQVLARGKQKEFSETDVSTKFMLPLLEALGWDIRNIDEVKEQRKTLSGPADYSLNLHKRPRLVLELKRFDENLDGRRRVRGREETYPEQAIRYAWQLKVDWVILSNFAETRLYYSHVAKPHEGLVFSITHDKYLEDFDRLWILSKEAVSSGILDSYEKRKERRDVDIEILADLLLCRRVLTENIRSNHPELPVEVVRESVQKLLDRILVIRVAEDRGIMGSDSIWKEQESWRTRGLPTPFVRSLKTLFRDFDETYNTKLFEPHLCEDLKVDNLVVEKVIDRLYGYNFDLISADVLGAIYEDYIGHVLEAKGRDVDIVESLQARRKAGIYYTPRSIVEYIVRVTLGQRLATCQTPEEVATLRILDPAVGSGSFLIKAFDILKEWYDRYASRLSGEFSGSAIFKGRDIVLDGIEHRILSNNLYGVDVDPQAAEIASVNLMLRGLQKGERLPKIVGQNIRIANSLVSCSEEELNRYFRGSLVTPISWERDFRDVFRDGGFDIVVGNPPWGADLSDIRSYVEQTYNLAKGQYDSYELFIELSKRILKDGGVWGFVVPDSIFKPEHTRLREFLCKNFQIEKIIKLGEGFFENVYRSSVIVVFTKKIPDPDHYVMCLTLLKRDRVQVREEDDIDLVLLEKERAIPIAQRRFIEDPEYAFDIASADPDRIIMSKMESRSVNWSDLLDTWRGIEFSEQGSVVQCPNCFNWDTQPRKRKGVFRQKKCKHCGHTYSVDRALAVETIVSDSKKGRNYKPFIDGEGVNRYYVSKKRFVDTDKKGINYKTTDIYRGDKLLVRKTGVGIYATIDRSDAYVPQAVFMFKLKKDLSSRKMPYKLEYFLGVLNSRLMLYYYFKKFGELEWKSFPYLTQRTIQQLPVHSIDFKNPRETRLHDRISRLVDAALQKNSPIDRDLDLKIEEAVMELYGITPEEKMRVWDGLGSVQKLRIIREVMGSEPEAASDDN